MLPRLRLSFVASLFVVALASVVRARPQFPSQWRLVQDETQREVTVSSRTYTLTRQNDSICDAGAAQWTGKVNLEGARNMFFWYFESRRQPQDAPLIIWLNGGPGASSMLGAIFEVGPCSVTPEGNTTVRNPHSWAEFANLLFVDQPIGVGFSATNDSSSWPRNLAEASVDFDNFLDVIIEDVFPTLQHRPIHFAGESFAGRYVPVYASTTRRKFDSVILIDPVIDWNHVVLGLYEHLCLRPVGGRTFNASACEAIERGYNACEKAADACVATYDADVCGSAADACDTVYAAFGTQVIPGGWNPYDDRLECEEPPLCGGMGMDQVTIYLNTDMVQQALGVDKNFKYEPVNWEFNSLWSNISDPFIPSTREIATLLDSKNTPVLLINGNNDIGINTEGTARILDRLLWTGHVRYQTTPFRPWEYTNDKGLRLTGGDVKQVSNLAMVTLNEAGHMSPHDQPEACLEVLEKWVSKRPLNLALLKEE